MIHNKSLIHVDEVLGLSLYWMESGACDVRDICSTVFLRPRFMRGCVLLLHVACLSFFDQSSYVGVCVAHPFQGMGFVPLEEVTKFGVLS